jgi:hypothetical protein
MIPAEETTTECDAERPSNFGGKGGGGGELRDPRGGKAMEPEGPRVSCGRGDRVGLEETPGLTALPVAVAVLAGAEEAEMGTETECNKSGTREDDGTGPRFGDDWPLWFVEPVALPEPLPMLLLSTVPARGDG